MRIEVTRRTRRCSGLPRLRASLLTSCLLVGGCYVVIPVAAANAQVVTQRVIEGKVELSSGAMAKGAIVYLKNAKTLEVRTYISTADGSYRFGQLNPDANYTIWAEYQGKKSKEKTVSSFDTKKTFQFTLKVDG